MESLQATLYEKGIIKTIEELRFSVGIPGLRTLEILKIADIPTTLKAWIEKQKPLMGNVPLFSGIMQTISQLPKTAIVTSQNRQEMQDSFYKLNISHHFHTIVCADDTEKHKPNAEPLILALQLLDCNKEDAIYIGDSIYDMKCSIAAGVDFGLAAWGVSTTEPYHYARHFFKTPADILDVQF